jgi:hypothetical protein
MCCVHPNFGGLFASSLQIWEQGGVHNLYGIGSKSALVSSYYPHLIVFQFSGVSNMVHFQLLS